MLGTREKVHHDFLANTPKGDASAGQSSGCDAADDSEFWRVRYLARFLKASREIVTSDGVKRGVWGPNKTAFITSPRTTLRLG